MSVVDTNVLGSLQGRHTSDGEKTKGMTSGIEHDAQVFSSLILSEVRSRSKTMGHSRIKVVDLDIKVDHLVLTIRFSGHTGGRYSFRAWNDKPTPPAGLRIKMKSSSRCVISHPRRLP